MMSIASAARLKTVCKRSVKKVALVVNYDGFQIDPRLPIRTQR